MALLRTRSDLRFSAWCQSPRVIGAGAALGSALALNLAIAPIGWWWLGPLAFAPLLLAARSLSPRAAFAWGWCAGTVAIALGFRWLIAVVDLYSGLPPPSGLAIHLLFAGAHGLQWGLFLGVAAWLYRRAPDLAWSQSWRLAVLWTGLEVIYPNVFPTYLGMVWSPQPIAIAHAQWFGVAGVSATVMLLNGLVVGVLIAKNSQQRRRAGIALALVIVAIGGTGTWSLARLDHKLESAKTLAIGVVQGNFGIMTMVNAQQRDQVLADMIRQSAELEAQGAEVLLWGETAYPYELLQGSTPLRDAPLGSIRRIRRNFSIPAIIGAVVLDPKVSRLFPYNSALVLQRDGTFGDRFDKNYPLWFGEHAPLVDPEWYIKMVPGAYHITRGQSPGVLRIDEFRLGAMICYEDLLPHFVRETTALGVHALVNLTNDSWFGDSAEPWQHLSLATLRAVENQRSLIRAVNAGVSAHIDPGGRIIEQTTVSDADRDGFKGSQGFVAQTKLVAADEQTFFTRFGDLQVGAWVLAAIAMAMKIAWSQRKRKVLPDSVPT